jgi:arginase
MWEFQGAKIQPEDIVLISVRDFEKPENYLMNKYNINFIEAEDVKKLGADKIAVRTLQMLEHCDLIYISFDVDSLDSRISSGHRYACSERIDCGRSESAKLRTGKKS